MADLHLCACSSGPHKDTPRVLPPGTLVVLTDPGDVTVTGPEVAQALGAWAERHNTLVVVLHEGLTLESLTTTDLGRLGLQRTERGT